MADTSINYNIDSDRVRWPGSGSLITTGSTPFGFYETDLQFKVEAPNAAKWAATRLGYPIVDIEMIDENKLIPCNGVYSVLVTNEKLKINQQGGMMNIGYRPTVEGNTRTIEVNLFDFDQSLYDETLTITLKKYLRSEVKFSGLDELKKQLEKDKQG